MSKHKLDAGKAIISVVAELGEALGYVVDTELPVEDRDDAGAVDVAWFSGDNQKFPLMIFEVESSATNAMANNPAKVFGQASERFERPLFFFHIVVKSGMNTTRIDNLRGVFGQHNYRVYPLERGAGTRLVEDILRQHRRIRSTINVGAFVAALLNSKELITDRLSIVEAACQFGLTGSYLRDLARLARQGKEAEDLFLDHLLHRFWEARWPGTDEGYDTWFGSAWSTPIHLAMLFATSSALRLPILKKLRWWQEESSYKGKLRAWGKTKGSLTAIPITPEQVRELEAWRRTSKYAAPEDFIFAGRDGNFMDPGNYRKRVLAKLGKQLGLPKLTFQVIRRTMATLAQEKGHVKDIQGMMRHSRVATTTDVYMQTLHDGVRSTVTSIHEELTGTGSIGNYPKESRSQGRPVSRTPEVQGKVGEGLIFYSGGKEERMSQPARGKVLEFATKMRQSRERKVPLSD